MVLMNLSNYLNDEVMTFIQLSHVILFCLVIRLHDFVQIDYRGFHLIDLQLEESIM